MAGVVDGVEAQVADLDHLGVVEEDVVADVLQLRGVERGDRHLVARLAHRRHAPGCGPSDRGSRSPGERRVAGHSSSSCSCSLAASIRTASPVWRQRTTNTLLSYGPTTTLCTSTFAVDPVQRRRKVCRSCRSSLPRPGRNGVTAPRPRTRAPMAARDVAGSKVTKHRPGREPQRRRRDGSRR